MFRFAALQTAPGLEQLDREFLDHLRTAQPDMHLRMHRYRRGGAWRALEVSTFVLEVAPILEAFLAERFGIIQPLERHREAVAVESRVAVFKEEFVKRRSRRHRSRTPRPFEELHRWLRGQLAPEDREPLSEAAVAAYAGRLLSDPEAHRDAIDRLAEWCAKAREDAAAARVVNGWLSFKLPRTVDPARLVPFRRVRVDGVERLEAPSRELRQRDGFALTDPRMTLAEALAEIHYCVYCHRRDDDFCSKGFPEKKKAPDLGLKVNPLGTILTGCPLEEKVSEMHLLKRDGHAVGALAVIMIDNPMVPVTGHRICNDCMKACIYQKQDPVDIPQIETRVLTDVLDLPWGVEIYDLLCRWNPLRRTQFIMQAPNNRRVLIAGMGPAGFSMAHHLTMEGCTVVGIDGLKIEPIAAEILSNPVRDYAALCESLDSRVMAGFGGVAEYGITVRWDKNFLKLVYLTLARRPNFEVFGGVRFGGTVTVEDAPRLGFDHVCIANGAGLPRVIHIGHSLARGMRQANDFLMALQLTGAAKRDSLANLQVRLPAIVIGGGLTAVDAATEIQAYYIAQVEKLADRHRRLVSAYGTERVTATLDDSLDEESRQVLSEFLAHAEAVRLEREQARGQDRRPDFIQLIRRWGGVTIAYRRSINESPAYLRNHEEIIRAMEEGIYYMEGVEPVRARLDRYGHVEALVCRRLEKHEGRWIARGKEVQLPARAILVAAGTYPNTVYEQEHPGTFLIEDNHFLPHVAHSNSVQPVQVAPHSKSPETGSFTSYYRDHRTVSFIGDAHPVFNGSVVNAIASAKRSYADVMRALEQLPPHEDDPERFRRHIAGSFQTYVSAIDDDHPAVIELRIRAPMAARNFRPGQFFRLQMYEKLSPCAAGTRLQLPLLTVTGAGIDGDDVRLILMRQGANARLIGQLVPGDPVVLMGPTGAPTTLDENRTVLVVTQSWGAAVVLGMAPEFAAKHSRVLYLASYRDRQQLYCQDELEAVAEQIIWATEDTPAITVNRTQDISTVGTDVVDLILRYEQGRLGNNPGIPLKEVDTILVVGATGLLRAIQEAMRLELAGPFRDDVEIVGSVGSPMQCMLKGVCAQCLQWQIDPETGQRTRAVFSCAMQDQPLMWIDIDNLAARQGQNRLQERLTELWVEHVLATAKRRGIGPT